ncbi:MAG: hypothetical protein QOF77_881 [Solirubrobacteraceae bacterium]|jgi:hypothetical protein|nr:hypothetical protein [Solirubrobacteraceae bacterium]
MSEPGVDSTDGSGLIATLEGAGIPVAQVRTAVATVVKERPEVAVAGAFAGGLIAAMIVRRLGR